MCRKKSDLTHLAILNSVMHLYFQGFGWPGRGTTYFSLFLGLECFQKWITESKKHPTQIIFMVYLNVGSQNEM